MIATSISFARAKSAVGTRCSVSTNLAIASDGTCSRYDRPSASILTRRASTSKPMTLSVPLSAAARASSSPVAPSPNTPTTALRLWIRFHALVYAGPSNMLNSILRGKTGLFTLTTSGSAWATKDERRHARQDGIMRLSLLSGLSERTSVSIVLDPAVDSNLRVKTCETFPRKDRFNCRFWEHSFSA